MASIITVDRYVNEPVTNRVIIYYTIIGSGMFTYVPRYTCFAEENTSWYTMTQAPDPRNTPEPVRVNGRRSCIFIWDALADGININSLSQKHMFAIYMRDMNCNNSSAQKDPAINLGNPHVPPFIPTTRRPANPANPGGAGGGGGGNGNGGGGGTGGGPGIGSNPVNTGGIPTSSQPDPPTTSRGSVSVGVDPPTGPGPGKSVNTTISTLNTSSLPKKGDPSFSTGHNSAGVQTPPGRRGPRISRDNSVPTGRPTIGGGERSEPVSGTELHRGGRQATQTNINPVQGTTINDSNGRSEPGSMVQTEQGPLMIPYGVGYGEKTGDISGSSIDTSRFWQSAPGSSNVRSNVTSSSFVNDLNISGSNHFAEMYNNGQFNFPSTLLNGDPNPYVHKSIQPSDQYGNDGSIDFEPTSFDGTVLGIPLSTLDDAILIPTQKQSLRKDPFFADFTELAFTVEPRSISRGQTLFVSSSLTNEHEDIPVQSAIKIFAEDPFGKWYEIGGTSHDLIQPDYTSAIGFTFGTSNFNNTGCWNIAAVVYDAYNKVVNFKTQSVEVFLSQTDNGVDPDIAAILALSAKYKTYSELSGQQSLNYSFKSPLQPLHTIAPYVINNQKIDTTTEHSAIYFSRPTKKWAVVDVPSGQFSLTIHNSDRYDFGTQLYAGVPSAGSDLVSHYGPVWPLANRAETEEYNAYTAKVTNDLNFGGIELTGNLTSGTYIVSMRPEKSETVANIFIGGPGSKLVENQVTSSNRNGSTWTILMQLSFGLEEYRIGYVGMNPNKIPSSTTWTDFRSSSNGIGSVEIDGTIGGYIVVIRKGIDGSFRPNRDFILRYRLGN